VAEQACKLINEKAFTTVFNSMIRDPRLSLKTKGLFVLMASLPPEWEFSVGGLATIANAGKDAVRSMLSELEKVGYLVREQAHDGGGKFAKNVYVLQYVAPPSSEKPDNGKPPLSENTDDGKNRERLKPMTVNPTQVNKDLINIYNPPTPQGGRRGRTKKEPRSAPSWMPERFEGFWKFYPRGEAKQSAMDAWDKLKPDDALIATIGRALVRQKATEEWKRGVGIPYASTYLNQRRWEDEATVAPIASQSEPEQEEFGWAQ
jgi:hypothetical protein